MSFPRAAPGLLSGYGPFLPDFLEHLRLDRPMLLLELRQQASQAVVLRKLFFQGEGDVLGIHAAILLRAPSQLGTAPPTSVPPPLGGRRLGQGGGKEGGDPYTTAARHCRYRHLLVSRPNPR